MRREAVTTNADGTFTVKGGGWFWVRMDFKGNVLEMAPGMSEKKAARLFVSQAKLTVAKVLAEQVQVANEIVSEIIKEENT